MFRKKTAEPNKFQRYNLKTDNELITENEYEKGKTNDLIEVTGFSNPVYSENCKYFKVHRTNETIGHYQLFFTPIIQKDYDGNN